MRRGQQLPQYILQLNLMIAMANVVVVASMSGMEVCCDYDVDDGLLACLISVLPLMALARMQVY